MKMYRTRDIRADNEVLALIRKRALRGRRGSEKIGLVIEGGVMRGVVSSGAAAALEELKLSAVFDAIYGTSAGAVTGAYFASRQASYGTPIFYDFLSGKKFFRHSRFLRAQPPMNIDYLLHDIMDGKRPLCWLKALSAPLRIVATDASSGNIHIFSQAKNKATLQQQLRASISLPLISGGATIVGGGIYMDGGIHGGIPWQEAFGDSCTHLLVLSSRPWHSRRRSLLRWERALVERTLSRKYPRVVPRYLERDKAYNSSQQELYDLHEAGERVCLVAPAHGARLVAGNEMRRDLLLQGAGSGAEAVYQTLFGSAPRFQEMLRPTNEEGRLLYPQKKSWLPLGS